MAGILLTILLIILLAPAILVAIVVYGIRAARRSPRDRARGPVIEGQVIEGEVVSEASSNPKK